MSSRETSMYCITTASTKLAFSGKVNLAKSLCLKYYHRNGTFITGRNEVVAKVIFLHLFVILSTGGLPQCMLGYHPPRSRHTHPSPGSRPPWEQTPSRSRHPPEQTPLEQTPLPPWSRHHPPEQTPPPGGDTPPEQTTPPDQTPAYGLRAAGTHPTGMHTCCQCYRGKFLKVCNLILNYLKYQTVANLEKWDIFQVN